MKTADFKIQTFKIFAFAIVIYMARFVVDSASLTSPSIYLYGNLALIILLVTGGVLLFRARVPVSYLLIASFLFGVVFSIFDSKVDHFTVPSSTMAPQIINGDHVVVEVRPAFYRKGDLVLIQVPERSVLIIRRIERVEGSTAYVITDNPERVEHGVFQFVSLKGKVLYVAYSWENAQSWTPRKDRRGLWLQ